MSNDRVIYVFSKGLKKHELSQKLVRKALTILAHLFQIHNKYAMSKEIL
jgi:hypothetical protein